MNFYIVHFAHSINNVPELSFTCSFIIAIPENTFLTTTLQNSPVGVLICFCVGFFGGTVIGWFTTCNYKTSIENAFYCVEWGRHPVFSLSCFFFLSFCFFAFFGGGCTHYGSPQASGQIEATAASLHHRHSRAGSEMCLQPTP